MSAYITLHLPTSLCLRHEWSPLHGQIRVVGGYHPEPSAGVARLPYRALGSMTGARFQANWIIYPPWEVP